MQIEVPNDVMKIMQKFKFTDMMIVTKRGGI